MAVTQLPHEQWASGGSWVAPQRDYSCGGNTRSKRLASNAMDSDSWEVRAFAEDASSSGQWPPRSYSCSFCQREFRTAQALGGHMNVHRRERAHANQLAQLRSGSSSHSHMASHSQSHSHAQSQLSSTKGLGFTSDVAGTAEVSWPQTPSSHSRWSSLPGPAPLHTVELLSPRLLSAHLSLSMSGSVFSSLPLSMTSPPSLESSSTSTSMQELGSSSTKPFLQSIPDILCESLQQDAWTSSRAFHPYEKSRCKDSQVNLGRFSLCLNKVMGDQEDTLDLELRLGQSSCAV